MVSKMIEWLNNLADDKEGLSAHIRMRTGERKRALQDMFSFRALYYMLK
jgi:hypothetical protein